MYVNPFWFGVICTLVVEIVLFVTSAIISAIIANKKK
jgi:hypothetical protein